MSSASLRSALIVTPALLALACEPPPAPPPPEPVPFGTITGRAVIEEGTELVSVEGAVVQVYGSSERIVTEAGKNFVLGAVPLGTHTLSITHPALDRAVQFEATVQAPFETVTLDAALTTLKQAATLRGEIDLGAAANARVYLVGGNAEQQADVGDDGTFTLRGLPTGTVQIGVSAIGQETAVVEVNLDEGDNDAPNDIAITPSAVDDLQITGRVQLLEQTIREGVTVLLNGGEQVAATDAEGNFSFAGLGPGLYSVRAQRPGFRSAELPSIALTSDGEAAGLVPVISLAPGNDEVEGEIIEGELRELDVEINNPIAGQTFEDGDTITFVATATDRGAPLTDINWTRQDQAGGAATDIGTGESFTATLPIGEHIITATATAADGATTSDRIVLTVAPFDYELSVTILDPTGIEPLPEGVPVTLRAATQVREGFVVSGADIEWSFRVAASTDPFTILGTGATLSVDDLPAGDLELRVDVAADNGNATAFDAIGVSVVPIDFSVTILAPLLDPDPNNPDAPPYFTDFGLPLRAQLDHSVQASFARSKLRWFNDLGGGNLEQLATGLSARTFLLPAGAGTIRFEAEDEFGNIVSATAAYSLQQIDVSVTFAQPEEFTNVLEGTPVTANVVFAHSLVVQGVIPASQLRVRYFSDVQGLLTDTTGATDFAVDASPQFDNLVPGQHTLTVSMDDGAGRVVVDNRVIDIRSPGVNAIPVSPNDGLVIFPGDDVRFESTVTFDPEVAPIFTWKVDGVEFDPAWDDYGNDPNNAGRSDILLGAYTPDTGDFSDARLAAGRHVIEFQVRLPDVDPALGCVNIPDRSACFRRSIDLVEGNPEICPGGNQTTLTGPDPIVLSGVRLLNCRVDLSAGADVIIEPGARLVVRRDGNTTPQFRVLSGSLTVGAPGNAEEVIIEAQGQNAVPANWVGITLEPQSNTTPVSLNMANTTLRHADNAVSANGNFVGAVHVAELRDTTFEDVREGLLGFCPDVVENLSIRRATEFGVRENTGFKCGTDRVWSSVTVEQTPVAFEIEAVGRATLEDVVVDASLTAGVRTNGTPTDLVVRRARITNSAEALESPNCARVIVEDSVIEDNVIGLQFRNCANATFSEPSWQARRNVFRNNERAIDATRVTDNPGQNPRLHLNAFLGNIVDVSAAVNVGADIEAQGNFFGDPGDPTRPGGVLAALPAGAIQNLPRIVDDFDGNFDRIVRADNPLIVGPADPAALPVAYIAEPRQTSSYHLTVDGCVPLEADAPGRTIAVLQPAEDPANFPNTDATCAWFAAGPSGDPLDTDRVALGFDGDGCWDTASVPLVEGEHSVALECTDTVTGAVDAHVARFLVDNTAIRGDLRRASVLWDQDVVLSGDTFLPAGSTLTINPGVTVSFREADADRHRRIPSYAPNEDNVANASFGLRQLVDLFIDGTLIAEGTAGNPVRFQSAAAAAAAGLWGGIRFEQGSGGSLAFVEVESASIGVHASIDPSDPTSAPVVDITDSSFLDSTELARGVCPTTFARVTARRTGRVLRDAVCDHSLVIDNVDMDRVGLAGSNQPLTSVHTFAANGPTNISVTIQDSVINRGFGDRRGRLVDTNSSADVGQIIIRNTTATDYDELILMNRNGLPANYVILIEDSHLENFDRILNNADVDAVTITGTTVLNADHLFTGANDARLIEITGSRFTDMFRVLDDFDFGSNNIGITITGNVFENVTGTVFDARAAGASNTNYAPDFSGNEFLNVNSVLFYDAPGSGRSIDTDMRNCFFGVTTEPEVRALLLDPQTEVDPLHKGRTDYTGFSATPLNLNVPPQP